MTARRIALAETDIARDADASFLSEVERSYLPSFRHPRRVDEFVAGRRAARRAIASLLGRERELVIERERDGAPKIVGLDVDVAISITHGRTRAIAVAAEGARPLGLDLADAHDVERIRRVARRAFPRENEREIVLADERATRLGWAIKESIGKALRIGLLYDAGFERIAISSLAPIVVRVDGADPDFAFDVVEGEDGVLVVACGR